MVYKATNITGPNLYGRFLFFPMKQNVEHPKNLEKSWGE